MKNITSFVLWTIILFLFASESIAQGFNRTYNQGLNFTGLSATEIANGYQFTSTNDLQGTANPTSFLTIQTDLDGNVVNSQNTDIPNTSNGRVFATSDGHFFVLGKNTASEVTLQKVSANGAILWTKNYVLPDVADLKPQKVTETLNGDILIAGSRDLLSEPSPWSDLFLLKTQANGELLQTITYPLPSVNGLGFEPFIKEIKGSKENGWMILYSILSPTGQYFLKADAGGNIRYHKMLTCCINDIPSFDDDAVGNVLYTERTTGISGPVSTYSTLRKLNATGVEICNQNLNALLFNPNPPSGIFILTFVDATRIVASADGGYLVSGIVNSTIQNPSFFLLKMNAHCQSEWVNNTYDFGSRSYAIQASSDGGYLFTGVSDSKAWLMKTDAFGNFNPVSGNIDLELNLVSQSTSFSSYEIHAVTLEVKNNSLQVATGVRIQVPEPAGSVLTGGNEYSASQGTYDPYSTFEWQTGPIIPGATAYLTIHLYTLQQINPLIAYAQVLSANETDMDSTPGNGTAPAVNEDDEANLYIYPNGSQVADLELTLLNNQPSAYFNTGNMRILVENKGPGAATNVAVRLDNNAYSVVVIRGTPSQGTSNINGYGILAQINWEVGTLVAGASATLDIEWQRVDQYRSAYFFAQVQKVDQLDPDSQAGNDSGPVFIPDEDDEDQLIMLGVGGPPADLELFMTSSKSTALVGDWVTYSLLVENNGSYPSTTPVSVKDILPSGVSYVSANASYGSFDPLTGIWTIGPIAEIVYPDAPAEMITSATLDIVVVVNSIPAPITNFAQIQTGYDIDATPGNDTDNTPNEDDEAAVTILPAIVANSIDLEMNLSGSSNFQIYQTVSVTASISNTGTTTATGVKAHFAPPNGTVFLGGNEYTASQGTYNLYSNWDWNIGSLPPGATATLELHLYTLQDANMLQLYTQVIAADQPDVDSHPGTGSCCVTYEDDEAVLFIHPGTAYCTSYSDFPWHEWISQVAFGSMVQSSGKSVYSDFTGTSTLIQQEDSYYLTLQTGFSYYTADEYWRVWIDYNQDGDFGDAGEMVFEKIAFAPADGTPNNSVEGIITIPSSATLGSTRMRVSMQKGSYPNPCDVLPFGEVEDYTVVIEPHSIAPRTLAGKVENVAFSLYPNPADNYLYVDLSKYAGRSADLWIYDNVGRRVYQQHLESVLEDVQEIDLKNGRNGLHHLVVKVEDQRMISESFMISRMY